MLNVLFIEADNQKSLGGSCKRDLKNINDFLTKDGFNQCNRRQSLVLSIDNFKLEKCTNDFLKNYETNFQTFVNNVKNGDNVLICISGHGYQKYSKEEKDSMDEYISFGNGIITDNILYSLLINKLKDKCKRVVCLIDTCHSGTMFDLEDKKSNKRNIFSLSACLDNQLDSCDISNIGFGGSLTVHLLDIPMALKRLIEDDEQSLKYITISLESKLRLLNQKPLLCIM
jgi:hypothetical protein